MKKTMPSLVGMLLVAVCFSLATTLEPRARAWSNRHSDSLLKTMFGEGRRLFANHFFEQADVYFHSGYYPSIFDRREPVSGKHMAGEELHEEEDEHEREMAFLKTPTDWIDRFGRKFRITEHTHLEDGKEREILPWLKLSAELDPQRIETYTVAAYWLRKQLGKVKEAEQFLRQGLRANPNSYEILFELGRLHLEDHHDKSRARNLWELALRHWQEQEPPKKEPNTFAIAEITTSLSRLEEEEGNFEQAIKYLEIAKSASPRPEVLQKQIEELKQKPGNSKGLGQTNGQP
jgi:tetratricopeptide (TPR) repeat protein